MTARNADVGRAVGEFAERGPAVSVARSAPGSDFPVLIGAGDVAPRLIIYGLTDPLEPRRVRYVGQTRAGPMARYIGHISSARVNDTARAYWITELVDEGRHPSMVLLEELPANTCLVRQLESERWWIQQLQARGEADLNTPRKPKNRPRRPS